MNRTYYVKHLIYKWW